MTGLIVGRFQPFHKGHRYLIKKALKVCNKLIIVIGSSNIKNSDNPWDANTRFSMINQFIDKSKIKNKISKIIEIPDTPDDDKWLKKVLQKAGEFDLVIGNNDWVNKIFTRAGFKIYKINHYKRNVWEGYKIRHLMQKRKKWQDRVPEYLIKYIL